MFSKLFKTLPRLYKYGFTIWLTDLLYDRGRRILPYGTYLQLMRWRDIAIEKHIIPHINPSSIDICNTRSQILNNMKGVPIWFLWLQGEMYMPDIVRLCYESAVKYSGKGTVILLTNDNLHDYIELPEEIESKYSSGNILNAHYSDIIRFGLLSNYGGLWIDATILLTRQIPDEVFSIPTYCIKHPRTDQFVFKGRWSIFFWAANSRTLPTYIFSCLLQYYKSEDSVIDYFLTDYIIDILYKHIPDFRFEIDNIPVNNIFSTKLKTLMDKPFDQSRFEEYTMDTWAYKLSYKGIAHDLSSSSGTFYDYIKASIN